MSWTAPRTYVTGELVTATILNTDHRDNLLFLKSNPLIGSATTTTTVENAANQVTVLTISALAIPSDVGAVFVEAWAPAFGHTITTTTGWYQTRIEEATAGVLVRGGITSAVDQRVGTGEAEGFFPLYMRTPDLSWAGSTRTLTLVIQSSACNARMVAQTDSPITMRVVRAY